MKRRAQRLCRWLVGALVVMASATEAAAQAPIPAGEAQQGAVLPLLLAVALLVAGGVVMGAVVLLRLRQQEQDAPNLAAGAPRPAAPKVWLPSTITRRAAARGASMTTSGADEEELRAGAVLYEDLPAERSAGRGAEGRVDCLDTSVNGMSCPRCHKLYDVGARYCPIDGEQLLLVEVDPAATEADEVEMVCSVCGARSVGEGGFCPHDGGRLQPAEAGVHVYAAVPVMFCPQTHDELPPGLPRPAGAPPLIPLLGRKSCGVSIAGPGPKRRLCPECGTRYPLEANWCGLDQARLVNIN